MINYFLNISIFNYFLVLVLNLLLFYVINFILVKKNILIDLKKTSSHKQLINTDLVPVSGGLILLINCIIFNIFDNLLNQVLVLSLFLIGLFADFQKLESPIKRLMMQTILVVVLVKINQVFVRSIGIPFVDIYLNQELISILFTTFCLLILINGSNFIDGANLQCSGYYFVVLTILIYIKSNILSNHDFEIIKVLYLYLFIFILFNFFNKSYLGDGGSYLLSFIVGFIAIKLQAITYISPYFIVLVLWYPAFENFFSILRKTRSTNTKADQPDLLHFHHLLFKFLNNKLILSKNISSCLPSIIINLFNGVIFYIGSYFLYSSIKLIVLIMICVTVYVSLYFLLLRTVKLEINNI